MTPRLGRPRPHHQQRALAIAVLAAVALAAASSTACRDATAPLPTEGPPREMTFTTTGFISTTSDIHVYGDTVVLYTVSSAPTSSVPPGVTILQRVPTAEEWRTFWRTVHDVGVRRWPAECTDASGGDYSGFDYTLAWSDARRTGHYAGAYPTRAGACAGSYGPVGDAARFQNAVYTLAGLPSVQTLRTP